MTKYTSVCDNNTCLPCFLLRIKHGIVSYAAATIISHALYWRRIFAPLISIRQPPDEFNHYSRTPLAYQTDPPPPPPPVNNYHCRSLIASAGRLPHTARSLSRRRGVISGRADHKTVNHDDITAVASARAKQRLLLCPFRLLNTRVKPYTTFGVYTNTDYTNFTQ